MTGVRRERAGAVRAIVVDSSGRVSRLAWRVPPPPDELDVFRMVRRGRGGVPGSLAATAHAAVATHKINQFILFVDLSCLLLSVSLSPP